MPTTKNNRKSTPKNTAQNRRLVPNRTNQRKKILVLSLVMFAIVGGGLMVYRSFAASTTKVFNYTANNNTLVPSTGSRRVTLDIGGKGPTTAVYLPGAKNGPTPTAIAGYKGDVNITNASTKFFRVCVIGNIPNPVIYIKMYYNPGLGAKNESNNFRVLPSRDLGNGYHESCTAANLVQVGRRYYGHIEMANGGVKSASFISLSLQYLTTKVGGAI